MHISSSKFIHCVSTQSPGTVDYALVWSLRIWVGQKTENSYLSMQIPHFALHVIRSIVRLAELFRSG